MTRVLCAVAALVAMLVLAASGQAGPAVNYNSGKSNSGNVTASPNSPGQCPEGEGMVDGKCVPVDSINYNASKSNTGGDGGPCPTCAKPCANTKDYPKNC
ncbi:MAG TPA: hypothetical protein VJ487_09930 [Alphaproteobacteria bacterium]|nr:hypothetical protein [Alphaproteobacteria bacterium]